MKQYTHAISVPHRNNAAIEQIEAIREVAKKAVGNNLQQHFQGEQCGEEKVAVFQHGGQQFGLLVVFHTHGQSVHQNGNQYAPGEVVTAHKSANDVHDKPRMALTCALFA